MANISSIHLNPTDIYHYYELRGQAILTDKLLEEGYLYLLLGRFQSDPLERRFSQYRQMSGRRFLVSLQEVLNSERILACRSLIMEVAKAIAGYIAKKLVARSKCMICKEMLISTENSIANDKYLNLLSRGLTVPSANLADFVGCCFGVLDFVGDHMQKHQIIHVREVSNDILHR